MGYFFICEGQKKRDAADSEHRVFEQYGCIKIKEIKETNMRI